MWIIFMYMIFDVIILIEFDILKTLGNEQCMSAHVKLFPFRIGRVQASSNIKLIFGISLCYYIQIMYW